LQSFIGECVELAATRVGLKLAVPHLGVEVVEPSTEGSQFVRGERLDLLLDGLDLAQAVRLAPFGRVGELAASR